MSAARSRQNEDGTYVSDSPYLRIFDRLDEVHREIGETELTDCMRGAGYLSIYRDRAALPNGKALVRLDFEHAEGENKWNCPRD